MKNGLLIIISLTLLLFVSGFVNAACNRSTSDFFYSFASSNNSSYFNSAEKNTGAGMANPAAVYCIEMGYQYELRDAAAGQQGFCIFPDSSECDEWQFYAGLCGNAFSYCAVNGMETISKNDGLDSFSPIYAACVSAGEEIGSVSELFNLSEKASIGDLIIEPNGEEPLSPPEEPLSVPDSFDWRNKDGYNWMTSVKNQGSCGSCWAFSALGTVEAVYNIAYNNPDLDLDLSEQQLVSNGSWCCTSCGNCAGGNPYPALIFVRDSGIVDETCFPYTAANSSCNLCYDWLTRLKKIDNMGYASTSISFIKEDIIEKGPLSALIRMSGYFDESGIYRCDPDTPLTHAVVIVGYEDTTFPNDSYWIAKNSWGSGWNGNGYFKVGFGECGIENGTYYAEEIPPELCTSPSSISFDFGNVIQGESEDWHFDITNCGDTSDSLDWTITDNQPWITVNPNSGSTTFESDTIQVLINTSGLSFGSHTGSITIHSNVGNKSGTIYVTVVSNAPNTPSTPTGPTTGYRNTSYSFSSTTTDPDGDQIKYYFNWDDGSGNWTGWFNSGQTGSLNHSWAEPGTYNVKVKAQDEHSDESGWSTALQVSILNQAPNAPSKPTGTTEGIVGQSYTFTTSTTDPDNDDIRYQWNWGNATGSWFGPYHSGTPFSLAHSWSAPGYYNVKVRAKDEWDIGEWSEILTVHIAPIVVYVDDDFDELTPGWQIDHFNKIQDGINGVVSNGTVNVASGTYYENIAVNKTVNLVGEEKYSTIIDGNWNETDIVFVSAGDVNISGFTVSHGGTASSNAGIELASSNNTLTDNYIFDNSEGLRLTASNNNVISNNVFYENSENFGVILNSSHNNFILDNIISKNHCLLLISSNNNTIFRNEITEGHVCGIGLSSSTGNTIYNNYFDNSINAFDDGNNAWNIAKTAGTNIIGGIYIGGNYWNDYIGEDTTRDGIGDTLLPYNSNGGIEFGGDYLPLIPNTEPIQDNPVLNSNFDENLTKESLTCYPQNLADSDGDTVYPVFNWQRNGAPITVLNMPFENNSINSSKDYSGYENNGTVFGANWVFGKIGGAYEFDSLDDFIDSGDKSNYFDLLAGKSFSFEVWFKLSDNVNKYRYIFTKSQDGVLNASRKAFSLHVVRNGWVERANQLSFHVSDGSNEWMVFSNEAVNDGEWHYGAVVLNKNTNNLSLYLDGEKKDSVSISGLAAWNIAQHLLIGALNNGSNEPYLDAQNSVFSGTIDQLRIYNTALSEEQIQQFFTEGSTGETTSTIVNAETVPNQAWMCEVTPTDLIKDGEKKNSNTATISKNVCGATITTNVVLRDNLLDCSGDGLIIGANDISLDCNGHFITGDGITADYGVNNLGGYKNVTIQNCVIGNFNTPVYFLNASGLITNNIVLSGYYGITAESSPGTTISYNNVSNTTGGGIIGYSSGLTINNNEVSNCGRGIYGREISDSIISGNILHNNSHDGIWLRENEDSGPPTLKSVNNILEDNQIFDNGWHGLSLSEGSTNNTLIDGSISNNGDGSTYHGIYISSNSSMNWKGTTHLTNNDVYNYHSPGDGINVIGNLTIISENAKLVVPVYNADYTNAPSALTVKADNITIDCGGFTLEGPRLTGAQDYADGINNKYGFENVTIKNCNIKKFAYNIWFKDASSGTIINNTSSLGYYGFLANPASNLVIQENTFVQNANAIHCNDSNEFTISNNQLISGTSNAIYGFSLSNSLIKDNTISNSNSNGIWLDTGSSNNSISNNDITGSAQSGIKIVSGATHNAIVGNRLSGSSSYALLAQGDYTTISNNVVQGGSDVLFLDGTNHLIEDNNLSGGGAHGIYSNTLTNSLIKGNTIFSNTGKGIYLRQTASNNTIVNNTVFSNNSYGIYFSEGASNNTIYNNYFSNANNAWDDGSNIWNTDKNRLYYETNIIGGPFLGGNYWSDYAGEDTNRDGLGETLLPYNSGGHIVNGGDYLPLSYGYIRACGETYTIDQFTELSNDLLNCSDNGIIIGSDNVVLNGNGHKITFAGTGGALGYDSFNGIYANTKQNISIIGCDISGFDRGINFEGVFDSKILLNNINDNSVIGIRLAQSHDNQIRNNFLNNNLYGFNLSDISFSNLFYKNFLDNPNNAFEDEQSNGNDWNKTETGNYWFDYLENPGQDQNIYIIPGGGDGTDFNPLNAKDWKKVGKWFVGPILPPNFKEGELVKIVPEIYGPDTEGLTVTFSEPLNENGEWQTDYDDAGIYDIVITISDGIETINESTSLTVKNKPTSSLPKNGKNPPVIPIEPI